MLNDNNLALLGGKPLVKDHSQLRSKWPQVDEDDYNAVKDAFNDGDFSGRDSLRILQLEKEFERIYKGMYAVALNSGTSSLHAALYALGVQPGDEVLVPNLTFVATAFAVLHNLSIPIFVDIDPATYNMCPDDFSQKITKRSKAVIIVHLHGFPADMDRIMKIAREHDLLVIEDVAQAPGALYKGRQVGSFGDASIFSLMSQKNLPTCGEAGMLLTSNLDIKNAAQRVRIYGENISPSGERLYNSYSLGWNYTLNPIQAAMALTQLRKFESITKKIVQKGRELSRGLKALDWVQTPVEQPNTRPVYHFYRVRLQSPDTAVDNRYFRKAVQDALNAEGLSVRMYQSHPVSGQIAFRDKKGYGKGLPWSLNNKVKYNYSIDKYPNTLEVISTTLIVGAISSAPGYLLKNGTIEKYIEGFHKINDNMKDLISYAKNINDYADPWEGIPVISDSFNTQYLE